MANGGRRVVIDDTHPVIHYSPDPPWYLDDSGHLDDVGNFGPLLNSTLHGTNANGSFSFSFSGTAIDIYGTNNIQNSSGIIDPAWNCYLNGVHVNSTPVFQHAENNWRLCGIDGLLDMNHTVTLFVSTFGQTFWFDYLVYTPSPSATLQSDSVLVPCSDSALIYDSSWQYWDGVSAITRTLDAVVQFQFTGTSLSWYGIYPEELPSQPALATFSIDGGKETTFHLQGLSPNATTGYNQLLFHTDAYPHALHTLIVKFRGGNDTTPLSLAHILFQTGDTLGGTLNTSNSTVTEGQAARPSISIAGLVCGVVALVVIIAILLAYFIRKRKQTRTVASTFPANTSNSNRPSPRVPTTRQFDTTTPRLDLAASSLFLEVPTDEDHSRRSTWCERLQTSLLALFNRTPHLGMVIANASTPDQQKQQRPPQIISHWARKNRSRQSHQRIPEVNVPHRPQMPRHSMDEHPTSGRSESGEAVLEYLGRNLATSSLSLPSVSAGNGRPTSSTDASYYGGYRTKREIIEMEKRQHRR